MLNRNSELKPKKEGYYIATNLQTGLQIGYDHFVVHDMKESLLVESRHTIFGTPNVVQTARFMLDTNWTPRRLDIEADGGNSAIIEFEDDTTILSAQSPRGNQQIRFPVGRERAYFMLSGAFYFPLHIVRRFHFNNPTIQQFDVIPTGICEVRQLDDYIEGEERFRLLQMKIVVEGIQDIVEMIVNFHEDLVRYKTKNLNLFVKLEERKKC